MRRKFITHHCGQEFFLGCVQTLSRKSALKAAPLLDINLRYFHQETMHLCKAWVLNAHCFVSKKMDLEVCNDSAKNDVNSMQSLFFAKRMTNKS